MRYLHSEVGKLSEQVEEKGVVGKSHLHSEVEKLSEQAEGKRGCKGCWEHLHSEVEKLSEQVQVRKRGCKGCWEHLQTVDCVEGTAIRTAMFSTPHTSGFRSVIVFF